MGYLSGECQLKLIPHVGDATDPKAWFPSRPIWETSARLIANSGASCVSQIEYGSLHMRAINKSVISAFAGILLTATSSIAVPLNINIKNSGETSVFIYWDETGRCAKNAGCSPLPGMQNPINGQLIPPGSVKSFGGDDESVQVGDKPTAHIFVQADGKFPATESSSKTFSSVDINKDPTKAGVANLNWIGKDLVVESTE
jgi:hypothetical protein